MARILIADDDEALCTSLARYLRKLGHQVVETHDGKQATAALHEDRVDLLVTDINMPDIDGLELLTTVREDFEDLQVIVMSGGGVFPKEMLLAHAEMLGAFTTITKPLDLTAIREAVESALGPGTSSGAEPK